MFEHKSQSPISFSRFLQRVFKGLGVVLGLVFISLVIGTSGYRITEDMSWIDAFYNASLIMSGMGPAGELKTDIGKIFASLYSLYSGLILIAATGFLLSPFLHRLLHTFHSQEAND